MRSLALASTFAARGAKVAFASTAETFKSLSTLTSSPVEKLVISGESAEEAQQIADKYASDKPLIIVDHYGRDIEFDLACRKFAGRIVVMDDLANRKHDADILIDSGAASAERYRSLVPAECRVLTGPDYAIVHPDFLLARDVALPRRDGRQVSRILVTFGQMDAGNTTALALDAIEAAGFTGAIDIVLGQSAHHLAAIRRRAKGRTTLHVDVSNMPALIATSDLAVGAGGVTAFERCCLGLPSVIVEIASNQTEVIATLSGAGAAVAAGPAEALTKETLASLIVDAISDREARTEMAKRGAALVDGNGIERIYAAATDAEVPASTS